MLSQRRSPEPRASSARFQRALPARGPGPSIRALHFQSVHRCAVASISLRICQAGRVQRAVASVSPRFAQTWWQTGASPCPCVTVPGCSMDSSEFRAFLRASGRSLCHGVPRCSRLGRSTACSAVSLHGYWLRRVVSHMYCALFCRWKKRWRSTTRRHSANRVTAMVMPPFVA